MLLRMICVGLSAIAFALPATASQKAGFAVLRGSIVGAESRKPLAGAAVVLCKVTEGPKCSPQANLGAIATADGNFRIDKLPPGKYFVFYDPTGIAREAWKAIDGKEITIKPEELDPGMSSAAWKELAGGLGCGGSVTVTKGTVFNFKDGKFAGITNGSFTFDKCGLTLELRAGEPLSVEVLGASATFTIEAWGR